MQLALAFMEEAQRLTLAAPAYWSGSDAEKLRYRDAANANGRTRFDAFCRACSADPC